MTDISAITNYLNLIDKVDELCSRIHQKYREHIACKKGCDSCCRHISVFPVEAFVISEAFQKLPANIAEHIHKKALSASYDGVCPLLENSECLLYNARPIICRTHGMPILIIQENGEQRIDYCPLNFKNIESLPGDAVIHLDRLNELLSAINHLFIRSCEEFMPERLSIAEAIKGSAKAVL